MQRVLDAYARWFNRSRRRDGPLFRGRFVNRLVETEGYWWTVLRYIDRNPVEARLAVRAVDYPHGSAWHYARPRGPRWLDRRVVETEMRGGREGPWDPAEYLKWAALEDRPGSRWIVSRRLEDATPRREDPLDELLRAAPGAVRRWMDRKAAHADGTAPGWPVVSPGTLGALVELRRRRQPGRSLALGRRRVPFWEVLEAGLLRLGSGLRQEEIAGRIDLALSTAQRRLGEFARGAPACPELLTEATAVLEEALRNDHGAAFPRGCPRPRAATLLGLPGDATTAPTEGLAR